MERRLVVWMRLLALTLASLAGVIGVPSIAVASSAAVAPAPASVPAGQPAFAWGNNSTGGLANGSEAQALEPTPVLLPTGTLSVATGLDYGFAVTSGGALYAWGGNAHGQLGTGSTDIAREAVRVPFPVGTRIVQVVTTTTHALALDSDGRVWTWGRNHRGQLGIGDTVERPTPQRLALDAKVVSIAAGVDHSLAATAAGAVLAWGRNEDGQLGDGTRTDRSSPVVVIPAGSGIVQVAAGDTFSAARDSRGRVLVWGDRRVVGGSGSTRPVAAPRGLGTVVQLDAGSSHILTLDQNGAVRAWGGDERGQLGVKGSAARMPGVGWSTTDPVKVALPPVAQITAGGDVSLALTRDGRVIGWGGNGFGQLGDKTRGDRPIPKAVPALIGAKVTAIDAGRTSAFAVVSHGRAMRLKIGTDGTSPVVGRVFRFAVSALDAFGIDLGPISATLTLAGSPCDGSRCRPAKPGSALVTAVAHDPTAEDRASAARASAEMADGGVAIDAATWRGSTDVGRGTALAAEASAPLAIPSVPADSLFGTATVRVEPAAAGGGGQSDGTGGGSNGDPGAEGGALGITGGDLAAIGLLTALALGAIAVGIVAVIARRRRVATTAGGAERATRDEGSEDIGPDGGQ